jgi:hypothetical protein
MSNVTSAHRRPGSQPPPAILRRAVLARLETDGEVALGRALGLHRHTVIKLATGRPVWPSTVIAAAAKLGITLPGGKP